MGAALPPNFDGYYMDDPDIFEGANRGKGVIAISTV